MDLSWCQHVASHYGQFHDTCGLSTLLVDPAEYYLVCCAYQPALATRYTCSRLQYPSTTSSLLMPPAALCRMNLPNVFLHTAEELVLHRLIDMAKISWEEEDEVVAEAIKGLPRSTLDEDFDLVSDAAFQDHDVLMLFDMPQVDLSSYVRHTAVDGGYDGAAIDSTCMLNLPQQRRQLDAVYVGVELMGKLATG